MEYNHRFGQENKDRIIELFSSITDMKPEEVLEAVNKYGLKKILEEPTLINASAQEKVNDLKNFITFMNQQEEFQNE